MRDHALKIFTAAVRAVQPQQLLAQHLQWQGDQLRVGNHLVNKDAFKDLYIIGAGKASAAMAREAELILGNRITEGIVVTKYEHGARLKKIQCIEAGHPVPDENSVKAGREMIRLLKKAGERDLVIALISGGASALLVDCPTGIVLSDLQDVFNKLLRSGATIQEMNTVRKHLSAGIKGGQLVRTAAPAAIVSLILSDVIGDPLESIASGPTIADPSTFADVWDILRKYELREKMPESVIRWLQQGLGKQISDTPKPGDPIFENTHNFLIGTNRIALEAAAAAARSLQYEPLILTDMLLGEASIQAAAFVQQVQAYNGTRPACLLMGGETTVTLKNKGKGGRNQEFVLAAITELEKAGITDPPIIMSAGTDGTDGPTDAAGAVVDELVLQMAKKQGLNAATFLEQNDSYHYFKQSGGHVITGPTQTNVMDIVIALLV